MKIHVPIQIAILLDFNFSHGRGVGEGVMSYARTQQRWVVEVQPVNLQNVVATAANILADGLIVATRSYELEQKLIDSGVPAINVSGHMENSRLPRVRVNDGRVGVLGAEHLLELGARSFAFYQNEPDSFCLRERGLGFVERLGSAGHGCEVFGEGLYLNGQLQSREPATRTLASRARTLRSWLKALPPRTAVMAGTDAQARAVINGCRALDIAVPDEIMVMGVDFDPLQSSAAGVLLTSVDIHPAAIGFGAARLLDRIFAGEQLCAETHLVVEPLAVVTGGSTDFSLCGDEFVARALSHARAHGQHTFTIKELAETVHLSRRSLERRFMQALGQPPKEVLRRLRIERAKELIDQTQMEIGEVARELGFRDANYFSTAFHRDVGCSPTEYRCRLDLDK